ncbi:MAG: hypothetical protein DMF56_18940 [Acidobacteria bacterium]|nr:MAG: hypothetical protein DMF56_18940 [Acidobacteriota bacterium]
MHSRRSLVWLLLGILLPGIFAVYFVKRFGVNVPVHDEWHFMSTVDAFYSGNHWQAALFEHYGEHRIPIPKAIILVLAPFTKYNVKDEMYLSAFLMMAGAFVVWQLLKKTNAPEWLIVPIGWLFLSIAQYHNLLVGWQFQIPLMNFFALLTILLLANEPLRFRDQAAAALTAFGATFSFANGLLIWPVITLFVAWRRRSFRKALPWLMLMIVAVILYIAGYHGFHRRAGDQTPNYVGAIERAPADVLALFTSVAGDNFGGGNAVAGVVAGVFLLLLLLLLVIAWRRRAAASETTLDPYPWLALALFSLLSAGAIAGGRSLAWKEFATASRYLTITIFIPIAILILGVDLLRRIPRRTTVFKLAAACAAIVVIAAVVQHVRAIRVGWGIAEATRQQNMATLPCLRSYRTAPVPCLANLFAADGLFVRQNAVTLERWRLGPFSNVPDTFSTSTSDDAAAFTGTIDLAAIKQTSVTAQGWALVGSNTTPRTIALFVDGTFVGQTSAFFTRPDVNQFFKRELPPVGWTITASVPDLKPGDHKVQAMLISSSGRVLGMLAPKSIHG